MGLVDLEQGGVVSHEWVGQARAAQTGRAQVFSGKWEP